jgi:hypothetical protein
MGQINGGKEDCNNVTHYLQGDLLSTGCGCGMVNHCVVSRCWEYVDCKDCLEARCQEAEFLKSGM